MRDERIANMSRQEKRQALSKIEGNQPQDIPEITAESQVQYCQEPLENHNQQTLCKKAAELHIEGRSIMNKSELIDAIRKKTK